MKKDSPEAPSSQSAREAAYADAVARGAAHTTPPLLSDAALAKIVKAARLPIASDDVKSACCGVLEMLAREGAGKPHLSKRDDLLPLLKAWRRWRAFRSGSAKDRLAALIEGASGKGFGPAPPPFTHPKAFAFWLADMALAYGVEANELDRNLSPGVLKRARAKAGRVADTRRLVSPNTPVAREQPRDFAKGGRPFARELDRRTEKLLAVFWLLFAEEPKDSIADARPLAPRDNSREATAADGGAAVRFIMAFEAEVAAAIPEASPKPTRSAHSVSQHIERLGPVWKRWALAVNADGSYGPMLVRPRADLHIPRSSRPDR